MISVAIIHAPGHPERSACVAAIQEQLPEARVLLDTDKSGDAQIANRRGCWPMARRAWLMATGTHHLVLEDDAVLCADFRAVLARAIELAPDACLSLFHGDRWCSVATVMPRSVIESWLAWADGNNQPHHDHMIIRGMRAIGASHWHVDPSIVDHAALPSLLGHPPVRALRFESNPGALSLVRPVWYP